MEPETRLEFTLESGSTMSPPELPATTAPKSTKAPKTTMPPQTDAFVRLKGRYPSEEARSKFEEQEDTPAFGNQILYIYFPLLAIPEWEVKPTADQVYRAAVQDKMDGMAQIFTMRELLPPRGLDLMMEVPIGVPDVDIISAAMKLLMKWLTAHGNVVVWDLMCE